MKKNLTEIVCILDRSGSMSHLTADTIGGFNSFIEEQREQPGEAKVTLALFDNFYDLIHNGLDLAKVPALTSDVYRCRGSTALLDALGRTITEVGNRIAQTLDSERPEKVIVLVITDGQENVSKEYRAAKIKEMVTHQREKYSWEFVFIGDDLASLGDAVDYGFTPLNFAAYTPSRKGTRILYQAVSHGISTYRSTEDVSTIGSVLGTNDLTVTDEADDGTQTPNTKAP